jgi:hypothetical protein
MFTFMKVSMGNEICYRHSKIVTGTFRELAQGIVTRKWT